MRSFKLTLTKHVHNHHLIGEFNQILLLMSNLLHNMNYETMIYIYMISDVNVLVLNMIYIYTVH